MAPPRPDQQAPSAAQRRFESLDEDAPRELWFEALRDAIEEHYLAEPGNPYLESGRSSGAARWEETRRCISLANAFTWQPRRRYDFVRMSLECVQERDRPEFVRRMLEHTVVPGGRLIVCHYPNRDEPLVEVAAYLAKLGYAVAGRAGAPNVSLAWIDKSERRADARRGDRNRPRVHRGARSRAF